MCRRSRRASSYRGKRVSAGRSLIADGGCNDHDELGPDSSVVGPRLERVPFEPLQAAAHGLVAQHSLAGGTRKPRREILAGYRLDALHRRFRGREAVLDCIGHWRFQPAPKGPKSAPASLCPYICKLDDFPPLLGFGGHKGAELGWRENKRRDGQIGEPGMASA